MSCISKNLGGKSLVIVTAFGSVLWQPVLVWQIHPCFLSLPPGILSPSYSSLALFQVPCSHRSVGYLRSSTSQGFKVQGFKENQILFRSWPNTMFSGWAGDKLPLAWSESKSCPAETPKVKTWNQLGVKRPGLTVKSLSLQNLFQSLWNSLQNLWRSVTALQPLLGLPKLSGHHSCWVGTGPQLSQGTGFTHTTTATKLSGPMGH